MGYDRCDLEVARKAALTLTGEIAQVPPMVSALRSAVGACTSCPCRDRGGTGGPSRDGVAFEVDLACPPRRTRQPVGPVLAIDVVCSSGTYVRSLAADLGAALAGAPIYAACGAGRGELRAEESVSSAPWRGWSTRPGLSSGARGLAGHGEAVVPGDVAAAVAMGRYCPWPRPRMGRRGTGPWAVVSEEGHCLPCTRPRAATAKPAVVLASAAADGALS